VAAASSRVRKGSERSGEGWEEEAGGGGRTERSEVEGPLAGGE
jgi:hypothetical protein